jgi:hypothetical protein
MKKMFLRRIRSCASDRSEEESEDDMETPCGKLDSPSPPFPPQLDAYFDENEVRRVGESS